MSNKRPTLGEVCEAVVFVFVILFVVGIIGYEFGKYIAGG